MDTFHHSPHTKSIADKIVDSIVDNIAEKIADSSHHNLRTENNYCNTVDKIVRNIAGRFHHNPGTKSSCCNIADKLQNSYTYSSNRKHASELINRTQKISVIYEISR